MNKNSRIKQYYRGFLNRIYVGVLMDALHKLHHRLPNIDGFARIKQSFHLQVSLPCTLLQINILLPLPLLPGLCRAVSTDGIHSMQGKL